MKLLEERIIKDGKVRDGGILKVDSFLNHMMDVKLFEEMAKEWHRLYAGENINKILTIEASGIGIAVFVAKEFGCPVIFAKKSKTKNIDGGVYTSKVQSYTHGREYDIIVSKDFLGKDDNVLIIDDFLAKGAALMALSSIVKDSGANLVGAGIAVEKAFQEGGQLVRDSGVRVESLARVLNMSEEGGIEFID